MQTLKHISMAYKNAFKYQWHTKTPYKNAFKYQRHTKTPIKNQIYIYIKIKHLNNPGQETMLNSAYVSILNT